MNIENRIQISKEMASLWLLSMDANRDKFGIKKCSSYHDTTKFPDMMLPATYNATNCLVLLGEYEHINESQRGEIVNFINSFQREDGFYCMSQMQDKDVFKTESKEYTWEYINFHITNYCMGAIDNLDGKKRYNFKFMDKYMSQKALKCWMDGRIIEDPWMEGNNIVNLASFYINLMNEGNPEAEGLVKEMLEWHDKNQDSNTGYWGTNLKTNTPSQIAGMAGAAHNYHIYYYFNRPIKYIDKIVDYCIDYTRKGVKSACLDVDVIDILVNMIPYGYRRQDIIDTLNYMLIELLNFQNTDGGFSDTKSGIRKFDGWVNGYSEPQGISNCFATWFRCITIGMISSVLFPERSDEWKFRKTIGIGYYNKCYNGKGI